MNRQRHIFLTLLLTFALEGCGCLFGNGEGYAGRCGPTAAATAPDSGQTYYWLDNAYTCVDASGAVKPSYRNQLVVKNGTATLQGDLCGNGADPTNVFARLEEAFGEAYLGLAAGIYERRSTAPSPGSPTERETQAWCEIAATGATPRREVFVRKVAQDAAPTVTVYTQASDGTLSSETLSVTRSETATTRTYDAATFHLDVTRAASTADAAKHDGSLSYGGATVAAVCRILP